ncbi:LysR family transcriptional regulator [Longirhabdus pacifica]|uniref:LysR family transcriptional regulator n=1 Tax=Longirhabdus pacifica TaxID=2305227 RepID=UPI001009054A|nr:LysR family transcriptional regulator [Longirhabdus pacifica]
MQDEIIFFKAVVEHGSLNQASKTLNISQPALSRKISKLEAELGVTLFERKGKKLVLTEIGKVTYGYAQQMSTLQKKFHHALADYKPESNNKLTIGASLTTLQSTFPDFISLIIADGFPLDLNARTGKTHEILSLVKEDRVDIGIVASNIDHADLHCIPIFEDNLALVVGDSHPLATLKQGHIHMLNDLPMVLFSTESMYRVLMDEVLLKYAVHPDIRMEIDSFEAITRLVVSCNFATVLPQSYIRKIAGDELIIIPMEELQHTTRTTSLIYKKELELSSVLLERISHAASVLHNRVTS